MDEFREILQTDFEFWPVNKGAKFEIYALGKLVVEEKAHWVKIANGLKGSYIWIVKLK